MNRQSFDERAVVAGTCSTTGDLIPAVVDTIDNSAERAYTRGPIG